MKRSLFSIRAGSTSSSGSGGRRARRSFARAVPWILVALVGSLPAHAAGDAAPAADPRPVPELLDPRQVLRAPEVSSKEMAGRAVFIVGALGDLYTTKRGFDAGLREANPLVRPFKGEREALTALVLMKVCTWFLIGHSGGDGERGHRFRGYLSLGSGIVQLGIGFTNWQTIHRARERAVPPLSSSAP